MTNKELIQAFDFENATSDDILEFEARTLRYKRLPVPIEEFIESPYYLGNTWGGGKLYPYWKKVLMQIYPDPIHISHTMVILTGPIGGGKTTVTDIAAAYTLHKLDCLEDFEYWSVVLNKGIDFIFFHKSADNAYQAQISPLEEMMEASPYFMNDFQGLGDFYHLKGEGLRTDKSTGFDVLQYAFSEVNFVDYDSIKFRIDQSISRLKSRFIKVYGFFGNIYIDSSAAAEGALVEDLIREYPADMMVVRDPIWVIKASTGAYFITPDPKTGKTYFSVYCGDGSHDPFIIDEFHQLSSDMDPDRVLEKVPNELREEFEQNIELALQNNAGIGTVQTDNFIQDKVALKKSFTIPNHIPEVTLVDFYIEDERLFDIVRAQMLEIPEEKIVCIGIDMGVSGDLCGFAVSYMKDYVRDKEGKPTNEIITRTPLALGISRKPGQETRIRKVFDLIVEINKMREVGLVVTDGYQSTQLRQDLEAAGIEAWLSSMDRSKDGYIFYKLQVYKHQHESVKHKRLQDSQEALIDLGYKVDHPDDNEKDISDAVVNSVWNINIQREFFMQLSKIYTTKIQMHAIETMEINDFDPNEFLNERVQAGW